MATTEPTNREAFARWWVEAWTRQDVDAIAAKFATDVRFVSPRAAEVLGDPVVEGRDALRSYWQRAVSSVNSIVFELDRVLQHDNGDEIVIVYVSTIDGRTRRACEFMRFGQDGAIMEAEAMHGCTLP